MNFICRTLYRVIEAQLSFNLVNILYTITIFFSTPIATLIDLLMGS